VSAPATQHTELEHLVGTTLAKRYRIDDLLGIGGMGAVFRARHLLLKRDVAVKVLHPSLSSNADLSKRFDREAQSAARLDHPNIIPVTEFGSTEDGMKYMVMQLLAGTELTDHLTGPLDPLRAIDLEIQILRGLEHAHQNGVVHRDLKPENVFVTTDHEDAEILKLVDFGIAKILDEEDDEDDDTQPLTRLGLVFGTPQYMSPEQATGSPIDHRTDIYSAGVMLYQMLAGRLPFDSEDPVALTRMQVTVEAPPLPEHIPPSLQRVVKMMMAKARDERYPDARSARKALQGIQAEIASAQGVVLRASPHDTGIVDPRDIYPPGHEALTENPAFAATVSDSGVASGSGSGAFGVETGYDPSEHSGSTAATPMPTPTPADSTIPPIPGVANGTEQPRVTMSLADALTSSHPSLQQRPPWIERLRVVPRVYWYVGGGVFALLLLLALWPGGTKDGGDGDDSDAAGDEVAAANDSAAEGEAGVDAEALAEIDKVLTGKNSEEALQLIRPKLDEFPENPQLIWREGKALALKKAKSDRVIALERYGEALELDPTLIEDPDFYAELNALLRIYQLREQAINLAVQKLGEAGHTFLLELVNNQRVSLGWFDRHRVLDVLRETPEAAELIDWKLNLRRDLEKAEHAPEPCKAFAKALDEVAQSKDEYFVDTVFTIEPPPPGDNAEDAELCELLDAKLLVVQELMASAQPDASSKYVKKRKRKRNKKK